MSPLRHNERRDRVQSGPKGSSWRWLCRLLPTLRSGLQALVVFSVIQSAGCESDQAASGDDGRGSSPDIQITGEQVRYLQGDGTQRQELASGSLSRDREEPGSTVWGMQSWDRLSPRRIETLLKSSGVSNELFCLTANTYFEARDQPLAGQVAVAQITMNRVASPHFPNDVCSVVYEHKQFSWFWDGKSDVPREEKAWKRAQMVAEGVIAGSGHAELMDSNITHYHAAYVNPYWVKDMQLVAQIGDHIFYVE